MVPQTSAPKTTPSQARNADPKGCSGASFLGRPDRKKRRRTVARNTTAAICATFSLARGVLAKSRSTISRPQINPRAHAVCFRSSGEKSRNNMARSVNRSYSHHKLLFIDDGCGWPTFRSPQRKLWVKLRRSIEPRTVDTIRFESFRNRWHSPSEVFFM